MSPTDRNLSNRRASGEEKCEIVELTGQLLKKMITGDLTAVVFLPPQVSQKPPRERISLGARSHEGFEAHEGKTSAEM